MYQIKFISITIFLLVAIISVFCSPVDSIDYSIDELHSTEQLAIAIDYFSRNFVQKLDGNPNIVFSPLSISHIFSMIMLGAKGETLDQLMKGLGYEDELDDPKWVDGSYKYMLKDYDPTKLENLDRGINLSLASIIYYNPDFEMNDRYLSDIHKKYLADGSKLDFSDPNSVKVVNDYVKNKTNGLIPRMINRLDSNTQLMLVNAIFMDGRWINQFSKDQTTNSTFNNQDGTKSEIQMMTQTENFRYYKNDDLQIIELPYLGNVSMIIILPQENQTLDVIKYTHQNVIHQNSHNMMSRSIRLALPKFKIEYSTDLIKPMKKMGVTNLFEAAELPGMTPRETVVSQAVHKAFIEVNESGTKAAAATLVADNSLPGGRADNMTIDRPFYFVIKDKINNINLFMGVINKL